MNWKLEGEHDKEKLRGYYKHKTKAQMKETGMSQSSEGCVAHVMGQLLQNQGNFLYSF